MRSRSDLATALRTVSLESFHGTAYRLVGYRYAATALSAVGSLRFGGRFNIAGAFEALYLSADPVTALHETQTVMRTEGRLVGVKGPPRILLSVECSLDHILDLGSEATLAFIGTARETLFVPWLPLVGTGALAPTQVLGEAAYSSGRVSALRAPSVRVPESTNLIVFPDRLKAGESIEVFDDSGRFHERVEGA